MRLASVGSLLGFLVIAASCTRSGFVNWPCAGEDCSSHGTCGFTPAGEPLCACDPGYRNTTALTCEPVAANRPDAGLLDTMLALDGGIEVGHSDAAAADAWIPDSSAAIDAAIADHVIPADTAVVDRELQVDAANADSAPQLDVAIADSVGSMDAAIADSPPQLDVAVEDSVGPIDAAIDDSAAPVDAAIADASALPDCRLFHPVPLPAAVREDPVNDFWGAAPNDLYAVTASGSVLHWDGCRVQRTHQVTSPLKGVWGSSASDVWAAGSGDHILRFNGTAWSELLKPATSDLRDLWGSSADDLWFVGTPIGASNFYVLRWTSSGGFNEPQIRNIDVETPTAVWGSAANDVWIVGTYGIVRHGGTRFDQFEYNFIQQSDLITETNYRAIWGYSANDIDIGGRIWTWSSSSGSTYARGTKRWNGVELVRQFVSGDAYLYSTHGSGPLDRWRVGSARLVQRDQGAGWSSVTECGGPPPISFNEVYAFAPDDVWFSALGSGIYHSCGGANRDADNDGHAAAICGGDDCNDCVNAIHPGALETTASGSSCSDGEDNDCDGKVDSADEGCA